MAKEPVKQNVQVDNLETRKITFRVKEVAPGDLEAELNRIINDGDALNTILTTISSPNVLVVYLERPPSLTAREAQLEVQNAENN